jgi:phage terminase large subunit-like protein
MKLKDEIELYCRDVKENNLHHCEKEKQAVLRFEADLKRKNFNFVMEWEKAAALIAFAESLKQAKDEGYGKHLLLSPWQKFIYVNLWGWRYKKDRLKRRFTKAYIQIARKNGKTTFLCPIMGIDILTTPGAEIYIAANQKSQSNIAFDLFKSMISQSDELYGLLNITRDAITMGENRIRPLSKNIDIDGFNASIIIIDEYHQARNTEMIEGLQRGQASRKNPLLLIITTAGTNLNGPCYQEYKHAAKILAGIEKAENYFPIIFEQDKGDDWTDIKIFRKSNPNIGVSVQLDYLEKSLLEAKQMPSQVSGFRTKNLDEWVQNTIDTWIPDKAWTAQIKKKIDLMGRECFGGIDLSKINDLTAFTLYFLIEGFYYAKHRFYIPEERIAEKAKTDNLMIPTWVRDGWITATPGGTIDYSFLERDVLEDSKNYKINLIGYDRYYSSQIEKTLSTMPVLEFDQSLKHFAAPTKAWEKDVLDGKIIDDNPVMRWCLSCATVRPDVNDNYKPMKRKGSGSDERIDGVITSIIAHSLASRITISSEGISTDKLFGLLGV